VSCEVQHFAVFSRICAKCEVHGGLIPARHHKFMRASRATLKPRDDKHRLTADSKGEIFKDVTHDNIPDSSVEICHDEIGLLPISGFRVALKHEEKYYIAHRQQIADELINPYYAVSTHYNIGENKICRDRSQPILSW
jgi:hypothetical protein